MRGCAKRPRAMLAGDLANPAEETLGGRAATAIGADAAGPRPEVIFVILAHRHRCRRSMQKHNKTTDSAAKSRANIDVSQRAGTVPPFGRCHAPSPNQCADHDILARWPKVVPSALILPSALSTVCPLPPVAIFGIIALKFAAPDRPRRSTRRTAGSPRDEQRCASVLVV